jgi:hypothetical protein
MSPTQSIPKLSVLKLGERIKVAANRSLIGFRQSITAMGSMNERA